MRAMYGETSDARDDKPAAPVGVKVVVVILLVCGLALAFLPLTVVLFGGADEDAAGETPPAVTKTAPSDPPAMPEPTTEETDSGALPNGPEAPSESLANPSAETAAVVRGPFTRPDGWNEKWDPWFQHVDWAIGPEAGMAAAKKSGKPMMLFYTATW
jgi:hypothetical protein